MFEELFEEKFSKCLNAKKWEDLRAVLDGANYLLDLWASYVVDDILRAGGPEFCCNVVKEMGYYRWDSLQNEEGDLPTTIEELASCAVWHVHLTESWRSGIHQYIATFLDKLTLSET